MSLSLVFDITLILPLVLGMLIFGFVALRRGTPLKEVCKMALSSEKDCLIVVRIILLLGCITGMWRASGTIAYFVSGGVRFIPPAMFVLASFLLISLMSYALGTSFGVAATGGAILMAIGNAGGVNPIITAGAVMSGLYVGDRGSPAASSGNLVAVLTGTDMRRNVRIMLKNVLLPFFICCAIYAVLSAFNPMTDMNIELLEDIESEFNMGWYCIVPAVLMLLLPFCNVSIVLSILISLLSAILVAVFYQDMGLVQILKVMLLGFEPETESIRDIFSGGGMVSMLEICVILAVSGTYGGIFRGAKLLEQTDRFLLRLSEKTGRYETMLMLSLVICAVLCNQTIGSIMQSELAGCLYGSSEEEKTAKMLDMENTVIVTAAIIPWCIACSVPLSMMGVSAAAVPFACFLYVLPLTEIIRASKKRRLHLLK